MDLAVVTRFLAVLALVSGVIAVGAVTGRLLQGEVQARFSGALGEDGLRSLLADVAGGA